MCCVPITIPLQHLGLWLQIAAGRQHRRGCGGRRLHEHAVLAGTHTLQALRIVLSMPGFGASSITTVCLSLACVRVVATLSTQAAWHR